MNLKEDIKKLAEQQVILKNQKKTVYRVGEVIMTPSEAIEKHYWNRYRLRHMYIVYGEQRGKSLNVIENKTNINNPPNERWLDVIRKEYEPIEKQETLSSPLNIGG